MFCDSAIELGYGDISFVIEDDCKSGNNNDKFPEDKFWIKKVNK